jgi:membrane protease YdiL (CAAX protease family)
VIAAIFVSIISIGAIVGLVLEQFGARNLPTYAKTLIGVSLQAMVAIGVLRLTVVGTGALSWREMGWSRLDRRALAELASGASLAVPVVGLTLILAAVLVSLLRVVPTSPLPPTGESLGLVVNLLAGAVIAPLYEEGVFRGFAITAWERTSGARSALVKASLVFAFAHVIDISASAAGEAIGLVVVGFAIRLPVAFALGWLFLQRRTIWAPIGLHVAFNAIQLVLSEVARSSGPT